MSEVIKPEEINFRSGLDLSRHKACFFGIQESGKTHAMKKLSSRFKRILVFQINDDDGFEKLKNAYVYKVDRREIVARSVKDPKTTPEKELKKEMKIFLKFAHEKADAGLIDLIIIDEADMFFQGNYDIDFYLHDLVLNHRHMANGKGVALWFATRRPQDIPTKIVESSKHLFIFKLEGYNAVQRFKEINEKIPEVLLYVDRNKHNFLYKELGEDPILHKPLGK